MRTSPRKLIPEKSNNRVLKEDLSNSSVARSVIVRSMRLVFIFFFSYFFLEFVVLFLTTARIQPYQPCSLACFHGNSG